MDRRDDYTSRIEYIGQPRPQRPWFLHPAFLIGLLLCLGLGGWALRSQLQLLKLRGTGNNAVLVDGQLRVELPPKALLLGEAWQWRVAPDSDQGYGLRDWSDWYRQSQKESEEYRNSSEYRELQAQSGDDSGPDIQEYNPDDYHFSTWAAVEQSDLDGDGVNELIEKLETRLHVFNPVSGWRSVEKERVNPLFDNEVLVDMKCRWDLNGDQTPDVVYQKVPDFSDFSMDMPDADLEVYDGLTGSLLQAWPAESFAADVRVDDFDGDGLDDLAYDEGLSSTADALLRIRGQNGSELGVLQLSSYRMELMSADLDLDGKAELVYSRMGKGIYIAGLGRSETEVATGRVNPSLAGLLDTGQGGAPLLLLMENPLFSKLDFSFLDLDMSSPSFDLDAYTAEQEKRMKEMEKYEKLLTGDSVHPYGSPQYMRDEYSHFQQLSAAERRMLETVFSLYDPVAGKTRDLQLPAAFLARNLPLYEGYGEYLVRLPGQPGQLLCLLPANSGGLLVLSADGSYVHYEELGEVPIHSEIVKGSVHDYIVLVFEDRIMVYP